MTLIDDIQSKILSLPSFTIGYFEEGDNHPHFKYILDGEQGDDNRQELEEALYEKGLR